MKKPPCSQDRTAGMALASLFLAMGLLSEGARPIDAVAAQLRRDAVGSLGGAAASAQVRLRDTAGLVAIGRLSGSGLELWSGFWHPSPGTVSSAPESPREPEGSVASPLPARTRFAGIWPNPVRDTASLRYEVAPGPGPAASTPIRIDVYDVAGRLATSLLDEAAGPGYHQLTWDTDRSGRRLSNGVYLLRFRAGGHAETRRIVLFR